MHNVAFIADLMRSGAALSAISAEQRLSYVPFTYPPNLSPAPSRPRALVDGPGLRRRRCRARCRVVRSALVQSVAWCATAALMGVAVAAPAPLGLTEAQQLAVERSRQMTAYDSAIAAARDIAVAAAQLPEPTLGVAQQPMSREKREARAERYAREADRVAAQKIATRVEIAREAALAWFDCYYVEQMTRIAADQLKFAEVEVEGAERMYWAGRLPQAEFYATRTMLVMFEDKSSELEHRGRATRIALTLIRHHKSNTVWPEIRCVGCRAPDARVPPLVSQYAPS